MRIFDAQIRSDTRTADELRNLRYFETTHVLTTAHPARRFVTAADAESYFDGLVTAERQRLERAGFFACVALGVLPNGRPKRAHHELWERMAAIVSEHECVVAVGEVGAWEDTAEHWELFERQVRLAAECDVAIVVTPPADLLVNMTYKMMDRVRAAGFPPARCLMNRLDARLLETVAHEGFAAGVAVGLRNQEPRVAAAFVADACSVLGTAERIVLNSSLRRGAADILGIPKTVVALQELGFGSADLDALTFRNAAVLYRVATGD